MLALLAPGQQAASAQDLSVDVNVIILQFKLAVYATHSEEFTPDVLKSAKSLVRRKKKKSEAHLSSRPGQLSPQHH